MLIPFEWIQKLTFKASCHRRVQVRPIAASHQDSSEAFKESVPVEQLPEMSALSSLCKIFFTKDGSVPTLPLELPFALPEQDGKPAFRLLTDTHGSLSLSDRAKTASLEALCAVQTLPKAKWHVLLCRVIKNSGNDKLRRAAIALACSHADALPELVCETLCDESFLDRCSEQERCAFLRCIVPTSKVVKSQYLFTLCSHFIGRPKATSTERRSALEAASSLQKATRTTVYEGGKHALETIFDDFVFGVALDAQMLSVPIFGNYATNRSDHEVCDCEKEWVAFAGVLACLSSERLRPKLTPSGQEMQPRLIFALCTSVANGMQASTRLLEAHAHLLRFRRDEKSDQMLPIASAALASAMQQSASPEEALHLLHKAIGSIRNSASRKDGAEATAIALTAVISRALSSITEGAHVMHQVASGKAAQATYDAEGRMEYLLPQAIVLHSDWREALASGLLDAVDALGIHCPQQLRNALLRCRSMLPREAEHRFITMAFEHENTSDQGEIPHLESS